MTKQDLQKELLEKVKEGVKPSDLRKKKVKDNNQSDQVDQSIPTAPITPNQQIKGLQAQISSLQKQLQTYKDFKEADLRIKERYKEKIKELEQPVNPTIELWKERYFKLEKEFHKKGLEQSEAISRLKEKLRELATKNQEQDKTMEELKSEANNKEIIKESPNKSFFCDNCQLTKTGTYIKRKVDSPFEPRMHGRICYLCSACSPYVKELSEVNFDKEDNPYKLE